MRKSPSTEQMEHPDASASAADASSLPSVAHNADAPVTRTPAKWAEAKFPATDTGRLHPDRWKHSAAAAMHGWGYYVERTGKQVQLTAADYDAALDSASGSTFKPHPAADYRTRS